MSNALANGLAGGVRPLYNKLVRPLTPEKKIPVTNVDGEIYIRGRLLDLTNEIEFKPHAVRAIRQYVNTGDRVVEVATGHGIFALVCHRQGATVETFEGARKQVDAAQRLLDRHSAGDSVRIHHALVEAPRSLWGGTEGAATLRARDLPRGDVLLLDCEGAEFDIIPAVAEYFDRIIVETHPGFGAPATAVRDPLRQAGFDRLESRWVDGPEKHIIIARALQEAPNTEGAS